jgi:hypothetical protein
VSSQKLLNEKSSPEGLLQKLKLVTKMIPNEEVDDFNRHYRQNMRRLAYNK